MNSFNQRTSFRISSTIFVTQSFFSAGFIAMFTLIAIISADLGGSASAAGIPQTLTTLMRAVTAYPLGVMMDRFGRRSGHALGYLVVSLGAAAGVLAIVHESYWLLLLAAAVIGMGRSGAEQTRFTAAEVYPESQRATVIGMVIFAGTIGAIGGPLLVSPSGTVAVDFGLPERAGAWILAAVFMLVASVVTFIMLRPDPREIGLAIKAADDQHRRDTIPFYVEKPARPLSEIFRNADVQLALAAMLISQTVMTCLMSITPLHMNGHDYSDGSVSIVIMAHTLGMFGIAPVIGRLIDRFGRVNMILGGAVVLILAAVIAPLSVQMPVLIASMFLLGVGWNFCFIGGTSLLSDSLSAHERGRAQGVNEALVALAAGLGSLSSGVLFDVGGYLVVCITGLVLTLVLTGMIGALSPSQAEPQTV